MQQVATLCGDIRKAVGNIIGVAINQLLFKERPHKRTIPNLVRARARDEETIRMNRPPAPFFALEIRDGTPHE